MGSSQNRESHMTDKQHDTKRRGLASAAGRRRGGRLLGAGSAVGAFLAFGMAPLAAAPVAKAD
ncbi:hypothetical protein BST10_21800, partial [Mycolicibacter algericus DSM 45454]